MKRSDMLKELYKITDAYELDPYIAERMLDGCEEAGMLPPEIKKEKFSKYLQVSVREKVHEWEAEDNYITAGEKLNVGDAVSVKDGKTYKIKFGE